MHVRSGGVCVFACVHVFILQLVKQLQIINSILCEVDVKLLFIITTSVSATDINDFKVDLRNLITEHLNYIIIG